LGQAEEHGSTLIVANDFNQSATISEDRRSDSSLLPRSIDSPILDQKPYPENQNYPNIGTDHHVNMLVFSLDPNLTASKKGGFLD
jgi:hypothetical protein